MRGHRLSGERGMVARRHHGSVLLGHGPAATGRRHERVPVHDDVRLLEEVVVQRVEDLRLRVHGHASVLKVLRHRVDHLARRLTGTTEHARGHAELLGEVGRHLLEPGHHLRRVLRTAGRRHDGGRHVRVERLLLAREHVDLRLLEGSLLVRLERVRQLRLRALPRDADELAATRLGAGTAALLPLLEVELVLGERLPLGRGRVVRVRDLRRLRGIRLPRRVGLRRVLRAGLPILDGARGGAQRVGVGGALGDQRADALGTGLVEAGPDLVADHGQRDQPVLLVHGTVERVGEHGADRRVGGAVLLLPRLKVGGVALLRVLLDSGLVYPAVPLGTGLLDPVAERAPLVRQVALARVLRADEPALVGLTLALEPQRLTDALALVGGVAADVLGEPGLRVHVVNADLVAGGVVDGALEERHRRQGGLGHLVQLAAVPRAGGVADVPRLTRLGRFDVDDAGLTERVPRRELAGRRGRLRQDVTLAEHLLLQRTSGSLLLTRAPVRVGELVLDLLLRRGRVEELLTPRLERLLRQATHRLRVSGVRIHAGRDRSGPDLGDLRHDVGLVLGLRLSDRLLEAGHALRRLVRSLRRVERGRGCLHGRGDRVVGVRRSRADLHEVGSLRGGGALRATDQRLHLTRAHVHRRVEHARQGVHGAREHRVAGAALGHRRDIGETLTHRGRQPAREVYIHALLRHRAGRRGVGEPAVALLEPLVAVLKVRDLPANVGVGEHLRDADAVRLLEPLRLGRRVVDGVHFDLERRLERVCGRAGQRLQEPHGSVVDLLPAALLLLRDRLRDLLRLLRLREPGERRGFGAARRKSGRCGSNHSVRGGTRVRGSQRGQIRRVAGRVGGGERVRAGRDQVLVVRLGVDERRVDRSGRRTPVLRGSPTRAVRACVCHQRPSASSCATSAESWGDG